MIILPDRTKPVGKLLMPLTKAQWRTPSQAQPKDQFGNENHSRFRLTARLNDGHIVWRGWFEDREDADAFLFAVAAGSLTYERPLWDLPKPAWRPDLGDLVTYEFATVVLWTSPTGGSSQNMPADWSAASNKIEALAGAGSGGVFISGGTGYAAGGGASPYVVLTNFNVAAGASVNIQIGTGGTAVVRTTSGSTAGNAGTDTWFDKTTNAPPSSTTDGLLVKAGLGGGVAASSPTAGAAGATGSCVGTATAGGRGGNLTGAAGNDGASGGGGAGGPNGVGANGGDSNSTASPQTAGGRGDATSGGLGGTSGGGTGGNGAEWTTAGSGGGGGARDNAGSGATAGSGGNYGAAGGAAVSVSGTATSGAGSQGIIVLTYTPVAGVPYNPWPQFGPLLAA